LAVFVYGGKTIQTTHVTSKTMMTKLIVFSQSLYVLFRMLFNNHFYINRDIFIQCFNFWIRDIKNPD